MRGVRTWTRDMVLGARFAVSGGPSGWGRTVLTAVGVALGVIVLLLAASVPHMIAAREAREEARDTVCYSDMSECSGLRPGLDTLLYQRDHTEYQGEEIFAVLLQPDAGVARTTAELPPGLDAFPGPGEMVVSPELARLLDSEDGRLLAQRLDYERAGTIGNSGVTGPSDLFYYLGTDSLVADDTGRTLRIHSFGREWPDQELAGPLTLLVLVTCVVLLMPVAVFVATAVRFGSERRDRRLAALRLVGADTAMTRRIAAGEALVGTVLGVLLGLAALLPVRSYLGTLTVQEFSAFPSDMVPSVPLAALIVLSVLVTAVAVTLVALRSVTIEPLGVFRETVPRRRRTAWRLIPCAVGLALLLPLAFTYSSADDRTLAQAAVGIVLLLSGVTLMLPWLVERMVERLRGGPIAWQLATRRLQLGTTSAARAVSGITVAVAGATALSMLFAGVRAEETTDTGRDPSRFQLEVTAEELTGAERARFTSALESLPGVTESRTVVVGYGAATANRSAGGETGTETTPVIVADCPTLHELARIPACADGDTFLVRRARGETASLPQPGDRLVLGANSSGESLAGEPGVLWAVPGEAREAVARPGLTGADFLPTYGVFATPGSLDNAALVYGHARSVLRADPADGDLVERVRNLAWQYDPRPAVVEVTEETVSDDFADVQRGVLIGAAGVMLLIGASMLVTTMEQLRERRRPLSVLVAFGTRRGTIGASVLLQAAIPVCLGLGIAAVVGTGLGAVLMAMVDVPVTDWMAFLPMTGVGAGVIALVTLVSLPPLWRMTRPDGLYTE